MRAMRVWKLAVGILLAVVVLGVANAQDYRAKLQGAVTDSSGRSVPGAKLTLHNVNTGSDSVQTSNTQGEYIFNFVEPGTYTVTAEAAGFAKFSQTNIQVQTRGDVSVSVTLSPGLVNQTISVNMKVRNVSTWKDET